MSEQVDEIRCRLCATYFPETARFCPNCREPRPDVHEDLLMAARLTGVSYEILLQRAWAEDGIIRIRQPDNVIAQGPTQQMQTVGPPSFVQRLLGQRDTATIGCVVLLGVVLVAVIGVAGVLFLRDRIGGDDGGGQAAQPTALPSATPTATPTVAGGGAGSGTQTGNGGSPGAGQGGGTPTPTPDSALLILNAAVPAVFTDGSQVRLIAANLSVISADGASAPQAGMRFVAIQVEVCAGSEALTSAPGHWQLEMPDGARLTPVTPVALPNIETATLANDDCNSGWITFEVAVATNPAFVLMSNPALEEIRYAWPG